MNGTRICSIEGCEKPHRCRGLCDSHYTKARRAKTIEVKPYRVWASDDERFWAKVDKSGECWLWTAGTYGDGYGCFRWNAKYAEPAHRVAFKLSGGTIPDGHHVDHLCFNRLCVKPAHLRTATAKQNNENRNGANANNKTSGIRGVSWFQNAWHAQLSHNKKHFCLGRYKTPEEAEAVVLAKRNELFTHNYQDRQRVDDAT